MKTSSFLLRLCLCLGIAFCLLLFSSCDASEMPKPNIPATSTTASSITPQPQTENAPIAQGTVYSSESDVLRLRLEYAINDAGDNKVEVLANLYLEYHSLVVGQRTNGAITLNGKTVSFESSEINERENTPHERMLAYRSDTLELTEGALQNEIQLSSRWQFNGVYGTDQKEIGTLTAAISIPL